MLHIQKVKTLHGTKWVVTEDFTRTVIKDDKPVKVTERVVVEYIVGESKKPNAVAVFPLTEDGLEQARELRQALSKKVKK